MSVILCQQNEDISGDAPICIPMLGGFTVAPAIDADTLALIALPSLVRN